MKPLHRRTAVIFAMTFALLAFLAYADDTTVPDSSHTGLTPLTDTEDTVATNWDSVYAEIQREYVAVRPIFKEGCYDCHSTETVYPWYHKLPLIKGMIDSDIRKARKHLDFTNGFPFKGHTNQADNLLGIRDELEEGEMPPLLYRMMHWSAKPSDTQRDSIFAWIDQSLRLLAAHGKYPFGREDLVPTADD
jgi:hypothetical protein